MITFILDFESACSMHVNFPDLNDHSLANKYTSFVQKRRVLSLKTKFYQSKSYTANQTNCKNFKHR